MASRRIDEHIGAMFQGEDAANFREPKIVTNRETEIESVEVATHKPVAGSEDWALVQRRGCHQVRLAVFREDAAAGIDERLRLVKARTLAIRNARDDRDRKLPGDFSESRHRAFLSGSPVLLNCRHGIAGIDHFRKNDQLRAGFFRPRCEITNRSQISLQVAGNGGDLGGRDFHDDLCDPGRNVGIFPVRPADL